MKIKIVFTLIFIFLIWHFLDVNKFYHEIAKINFIDLLIVAGLCLFSIGFQTLRWCYMSRNKVGLSLFGQALLFWRANFFNLITPASLGGDVYRVAVAYKIDPSSTGMVGLIVKERIIGLLGIFVSYLICLGTYTFLLLHEQRLPNFFFLTGALFFIGIISLFIFQMLFSYLIVFFNKVVNGKWKKRLADIHYAMQYDSIAEFGILMLLTLIAMSSWIGVYYYLFQILYKSGMAIEVIGLMSIFIEIIRWIPVTIQGIGIREGVSMYGFELLGYSAEAGLMVTGLAYAINTLVLAIVGCASMILTFFLSHHVNINPPTLKANESL